MNAIAGCSSFWYVPNALLYHSQSTLHLWPGNATHTVHHWKANHDFDTLSSSLLELLTASDSVVEWKTWFLYWLTIHKAQPNLYVGDTCLGRKIFAAILSIRCFWGIGGSEKRKREKAPPPPSPILNLLSPSPLGRPDTQAILSPIWQTLLFATLALPDKTTLRWRNLALLRLLRRQAVVKTTRTRFIPPSLLLSVRYNNYILFTLFSRPFSEYIIFKIRFTNISRCFSGNRLKKNIFQGIKSI